MVLGNPFEQGNDSKNPRVSNVEGSALPFDRLASHVADLVLLVPIMALAMAPFRRAIMEAKLLDNPLDSDWALIQSLVAAFAVGVVWETFFIAMWGTTPGRAIFGLRVVDLWTGEKPRLFNAFLRAIAWYGSVLVLGAPFFGVYCNSKRRPLHDRVGDTEVRSRNTRRQSAAPQMSELAVGSLFTLGAVFFATLVLTSQAYVLKEHARLASAKDEPKLCEEVSNAIETWETRDQKPSRMSVALSLSAAGVIESDCLERESDYALWNNQGRALGYLGKGLIRYNRDVDDSEKYFAKVCDLEPDSDSCRIVGWYQELSIETENKSNETLDILESIAKTLVPNGARSVRASTTPDWLRLLVLRELFVHKGDPQLILQLTQEPAKHELIGAKLVEYRARALWRLDRKHEAKATVFATADALPRRQRVVLTSWLCNRELYESSNVGTCTADANRACEMMERAAEEDSGDYATPTYVVASLRHAECRIGRGRGATAFAELAKYSEDPTGRKLIESVRMLRTEERAKGLEDLRGLASSENSDEDLFVTEANIRLVQELGKSPPGDISSAKELSSLRERWYKSQKARRYADWGRALFETLSKRQEWGKAAEVGVLLGADFESDRSLQSRIAISAWKAGKQQLASELVDSLEKTRFPASVDEPAESSSELKVLARIRQSGKSPKQTEHRK